MRLEEQPGISRHDLWYTGHQLQGKHLHSPVSSARSFDIFDARHVTASNCSSADRCDLATFEYICHQRFVGSSPQGIPGAIEHTTCHQPVFILSLCFQALMSNPGSLKKSATFSYPPINCQIQCYLGSAVPNYQGKQPQLLQAHQAHTQGHTNGMIPQSQLCLSHLLFPHFCWRFRDVFHHSIQCNV